MVEPLLLLTAALLVLSIGVFIGAYWGFRNGVRDGRSSAEMERRANWVEMLETSISESRSRAAHPSRGDASNSDLTGRQKS